MDELRAALNQFIQALAEQMRKNPADGAPARPQQRGSCAQQDLQSMLDRMEQLCATAPRMRRAQMLDQLQQMLENLQMARPGQMATGRR